MWIEKELHFAMRLKEGLGDDWKMLRLKRSLESVVIPEVVKVDVKTITRNNET